MQEKWESACLAVLGEWKVGVIVDHVLWSSIATRTSGASRADSWDGESEGKGERTKQS